MTPRLSGHISISGLVFVVLKFLMGIARQWSREKFAILSLNPRSHVKILIYLSAPVRVLAMKPLDASADPSVSSPLFARIRNFSASMRALTILPATQANATKDVSTRFHSKLSNRR